MPKASLEFDLPEEREEFATAIAAGRYSCLIHDFEEFLRREYKHQEIPPEMTAKEMWEKVKDKFFELKEENSIEC